MILIGKITLEFYVLIFKKMELTAKLDLKTDHVVEEYPEYDTPWLKSKFQIMKNLIVLGLAWIFLFTVIYTS